MGNSESNESRILNYQNNVNMETLMKLIKKPKNDKINIDHLKLILNNTDTDYSQYDQGLLFYHWLVINAVLIEKNNLIDVCDLVYMYRDRFGSIDRPANRDDHVEYYMIKQTGKYSVEFRCIMSAMTYRLNLITPIGLCVHLKVGLETANNTNFDLILQLFNRIKKKPQLIEIKPRGDHISNNEHNLCHVCEMNVKNIVFYPCKHLYCCATCALKLKTCPLCRQNIQRSERIFL